MTAISTNETPVSISERRDRLGQISGAIGRFISVDWPRSPVSETRRPSASIAARSDR